MFNPDVKSVVVFAKGEGGYETCRIPSILVIEDGEIAGGNDADVLVVFAEGRIADPTPVYDKNTDTIGLIFQASTKESGYKMSPFYLQGKPSADGSIVWNKASAQNLAETSGLSFSPGPSKETQLEDGTLAFPITACSTAPMQIAI